MYTLPRLCSLYFLDVVDSGNAYVHTYIQTYTVTHYELSISQRTYNSLYTLHTLHT